MKSHDVEGEPGPRGSLERVTAAVISMLGFETLLTLLIFLPRVKASQAFSWVPLDATVPILILSMAVAVHLLRSGKVTFRRAGLPYLITYSLFVMWIAVTLFWSPDSNAGIMKVGRQVVLAVPLIFLVSTIVASSRERVVRLLVNILTLAVVIASFVVVAKLREPNALVVGVWGSTYLGVSRTLGLIVPVVPYLLVKTTGRARVLVTLAGSLLWVGLFVSGGRAPLIAALISSAVGMYLIRDNWIPLVRRLGAPTHWSAWRLVLAVAATLLIVTAILVSPTAKRMSLGLQDGTSEGTSLRIGWYGESWDLWLEAPIIGHGVDSWSVLSEDGSRFAYPHNIFLELGVETGVIGLSLLALLGVLAWGRVRSGLIHGDWLRGAVALVVLSAGLSALTSGDINDNRILFVMAGLLFAPGPILHSPFSRHRCHVVHVTTVHPATDPRIFEKECRSLVDAGYRVSLLSPTASLIEESDVEMLSLERVRGRLARMVLQPLRVLRAVRDADPDIVHIHDPELLMVASCLVARDIRVIIDIHEHTAAQILDKPWIPKVARGLISVVYRCVDRIAAYVSHQIVVAEPQLQALYPDGKTVLVQNFPRLSDDGAYTESQESAVSRPQNGFIYAGGISGIRGAWEMLEAVSRLPVDTRLTLAGQFQPPSLESEAAEHSGWSRVTYLGQIRHERVLAEISRSLCGLAVLHPRPNYIDAWPTKLFEYMAMGVPVIVSDFPLWRRIVDEAGCGLLVDPLDVESVREAMLWMIEHPQQAREMGESGRAAVRMKYSWSAEAERLIAMYDRLASQPA